MAWKTNGLVTLMEREGNLYLAKKLGQAQTIALWDPIIAGLEDIPESKPSTHAYAYAYLRMTQFSKDWKYDSGHRKYSKKELREHLKKNL